MKHYRVVLICVVMLAMAICNVTSEPPTKTENAIAEIKKVLDKTDLDAVIVKKLVEDATEADDIESLSDPKWPVLKWQKIEAYLLAFQLIHNGRRADLKALDEVQEDQFKSYLRAAFARSDAGQMRKAIETTLAGDKLRSLREHIQKMATDSLTTMD